MDTQAAPDQSVSDDDGNLLELMRLHLDNSSRENTVNLLRALKHGITPLHFRARHDGPMPDDPAAIPLFPRSDPYGFVTVVAAFLEADAPGLRRLCAEHGGSPQVLPACTLFQACDAQDMKIMVIDPGTPHALYLARTLDSRSALLPLTRAQMERERGTPRTDANTRADRLKRRR